MKPCKPPQKNGRPAEGDVRAKIEARYGLVRYVGEAELKLELLRFVRLSFTSALGAF